MANTNAPFGLRVAGSSRSDGMVRNVDPVEYNIASGLAEDIYHGDPVLKTGTGRNISLAAAASEVCIGTFQGCQYWDDSQGRYVRSKHWPTGKTSTKPIIAYVLDNPDNVFEIQFDSLAEADVGLTIDWNAGTPDTVYNRSGAYAQNSTKHATTGSLRILGKVEDGQNAYGAYCKGLVTFFKHGLNSGGGV